MISLNFMFISELFYFTAWNFYGRFTTQKSAEGARWCCARRLTARRTPEKAARSRECDHSQG